MDTDASDLKENVDNGQNDNNTNSSRQNNDNIGGRRQLYFAQSMCRFVNIDTYQFERTDEWQLEEILLHSNSDQKFNKRSLSEREQNFIDFCEKRNCIYSTLLPGDNNDNQTFHLPLEIVKIIDSYFLMETCEDVD
jgi:hypothetical protein